MTKWVRLQDLEGSKIVMNKDCIKGAEQKKGTEYIDVFYMYAPADGLMKLSVASSIEDFWRVLVND